MTSSNHHLPGVVYEDRLVVFLDILGFSKCVDQSAGDVSKQQLLYNFLKKYSRHGHAKRVFFGVQKGDGSPCNADDVETLKVLCDYRFTQFSDSFIFSVKAQNTSSVGYFPLLTGQFMLHALELGFLVRGGVAKGLMVHEEDGPAFGPAFIQAYRIESGQAVFARTVLSQAAFDCISQSTANATAWIETGLDDEHEITIASFLKQKYSSPLVAVETKIAALNEAMLKIEQMLEDLHGHEQDSVGGKYRYAISRLRQAINEFEGPHP